MMWLSANRFGYELLKHITKKNANIKAIVTLSNDSETIMYDGVPNEKWYKFNIPVYEIKNINNELDLLKKINPDYIIMCGWRQIIGEDILKEFENKIISFHPTLLPFGRGPAPIINSILYDVRYSGLTMYFADDSLDGGDIIGQFSFIIEKDDYADDVYKKIINAGKKLLDKYLYCIESHDIPRKKQDTSKSSYFKKVTKKDNEINLEKESSDVIYKKIRAFSHPYLGAFIKKDNKKLIIWKANIE